MTEKMELKAKAVPPQDELKRLLSYEPSTGQLFWRARTPDMFKDGHHSARVCRMRLSAQRLGM